MDTTTPKKRRPRYRGTHPRKFEEKYKELDLERYPEEADKVKQRGNTPAGTHRPICVGEILEVLSPSSGQLALDATLGYGGHAEELLERLLPDGQLWGIDVDPLELPRTEARLRKLGFGEEVLRTRQLNFAGIPKLVEELGRPFDMILADLGVSSMQLDNPSRGFTFKREGPLDLRLNPQRGQPASVFVKGLSESGLCKLLETNADEPYARQIAAEMSSCREKLTTTTALAAAIRRALPVPKNAEEEEEVNTSIRRSFQALRIAINGEFSALDQFLRTLPLCLAPGGRVAVLTFHSGEERRVSASFMEGLQSGLYQAASQVPQRPAARERFENPRAKSALLHWAIRSGKQE